MAVPKFKMSRARTRSRRSQWKASSADLVAQLKKKVKKRKIGDVCRFVYDRAMPQDFLDFLIDAFHIQRDEFVPGDKHLNLEDLRHLPNPNKSVHGSEKPKPMKLTVLDEKESIFNYVAQKDLLLYYPYHSFEHFIHFLYEAVHNPETREIMVTQYRVAENSAVINTLIAAAQNGKKVTVFVELKARFDACPEELRAALNAVCDDGKALEDRMDAYQAQTFTGEVEREMLAPDVQDELSAKAEQDDLDAEAAARVAGDAALSEAQTALSATVAQKCEIYFGTYTPSDSENTDYVNLGFQPKAVFLMSNQPTAGYAVPPLLAVREVPHQILHITENGFAVERHEYRNNSKSVPYRYIAFA